MCSNNNQVKIKTRNSLMLRDTSAKTRLPSLFSGLKSLEKVRIKERKVPLYMCRVRVPILGVERGWQLS